MSRDIDKKPVILYSFIKGDAMDVLLAQKMALETQWNNAYLKTGVYSVDMKNIEGKISCVKNRIIQRDIARAKFNY